jgi:hypothetical protein
MVEQGTDGAELFARLAKVAAHQEETLEGDQDFGEVRLFVEACRKLARSLEQRNGGIGRSLDLKKLPAQAACGAHFEEVALTTLG